MVLIKQTDTFRCTLVAVTNSLRLLGYPVTLKDIINIKDVSCEGATEAELLPIFSHFGLDAKILFMRNIDKLQIGDITSYQSDLESYHMVTVVDKHTSGFGIANFRREELPGFRWEEYDTVYLTKEELKGIMEVVTPVIRII